MSRHGDWQAQRSSSGAWATSLEPAVAPIHHRRESAGSLDVGFVPAALQRVRGLRPLLKCALRKNRGQRTFLQSPAADGRSRRHRYRTAGLGRIDAFSQFTATYAWTPPVAGESPEEAFIACARVGAGVPSAEYRVHGVRGVSPRREEQTGVGDRGDAMWPPRLSTKAAVSI